MDRKTEHQRRKAVNLTIREDVLTEAKALKLNASKIAERGLLSAIKTAREQEWLSANTQALTAHNRRVSERGTLLTPGWIDE